MVTARSRAAGAGERTRTSTGSGYPASPSSWCVYLFRHTRTLARDSRSILNGRFEPPTPVDRRHAARLFLGRDRRHLEQAVAAVQRVGDVPVLTVVPARAAVAPEAVAVLHRLA